jgi:asparaginyl-tRNA synthetase
MRPALALRPASAGVSRVLRPRRVPSFHRYVSQQANRSVAELLRWRPAKKVDDVVVNGFVRSVRSMKTNRFVALGDGSSLAPLQALVPADHAEE